MASIDQAIPAEDYLTECIAKIPLAKMLRIASTMLAAMNFCNENKSKASNSGTNIRKVRTLLLE